jgi:magnesium chelatase accessory protein
VSRKPDWATEGATWPNHEASRFVDAGGVRWHVQIMGEGRPLLLIHGAGAASHSWRDVGPRLAKDFTVIIPDLPGHGFTSTPRGDGLSLPGMARALSALLDTLGLHPDATAAHSAGAAIALQMRLAGRLGQGALISLNGALRPYGGAAGAFFQGLSRLLFLNPLAIQVFALRAGRPGAAARLIESTGSKIDPVGLEAYARLIRTPGHIEGALGMMGHWNLIPLVADLPKVTGPITLVAADNDRAVPPAVAEAAHALMPTSRLVRWPNLGHLAHEEAPELAADLIRDVARVSAS